MNRARSYPARLAFRPWALLATVLVVVSALATDLGLAVAVTKAEPKIVGAVGAVKRVAEDRQSFEFSGKGLPRKTQVQMSDKKIEFLRFEGTTMGQVKAGDTLFVLGVPQGAQPPTLGPQIGSIRAVVTGRAFKIPELPPELRKIRGLKWSSGDLRIDGKILMLGEHRLATGASRPITKVIRGGKVKVDKKVRVYVFGSLRKKDKSKGEKNGQMLATKIYVLDRKVPSKEHSALFKMGVFKPPSGLDF